MDGSEDLEDMVRGVPSSKKLFIGGNLNGYVGTIRGGLSGYMGVFDIANRIKREKTS
jgi:hypothetical protein